MAAIVSGVNFDAESDFIYTKAKVNASGGKSVGILNKSSNKSLYISTPLMLTWGVNVYEDEKTGNKKYEMALQFPNDEYNNPDCVSFLKNMQTLEQKLKDDAITNSKDWLNKAKLVPDAVDALWTPMLKYPKDKETSESDYSRPPTLRVKIPCWEGDFKVELYNDNKELLFPNDGDSTIGDFIVKASNVATIVQCGGIWVANGKFGVTWKLFQAVVKPRASLSGKCHIHLTDGEKEKMNSTANDDSGDEKDVVKPTVVEDSDEEDEEVKEEVKAAVAKKVVTEDAPKKKRVVKKKSSD